MKTRFRLVLQTNTWMEAWGGGLKVQTPGPGSDPECVCNNNQSLRPRGAAPLRRRFHTQLIWGVLKDQSDLLLTPAEPELRTQSWFWSGQHRCVPLMSSTPAQSQQKPSRPTIQGSLIWNSSPSPDVRKADFQACLLYRRWPPYPPVPWPPYPAVPWPTYLSCVEESTPKH